MNIDSVYSGDSALLSYSHPKAPIWKWKWFIAYEKIFDAYNLFFSM